MKKVLQSVLFVVVLTAIFTFVTWLMNYFSSSPAENTQEYLTKAIPEGFAFAVILLVTYIILGRKMRNDKGDDESED